MEMMKRMLACLVTALFLVGLVGIAQAAERDNSIDFCLEGAAYKRDFKERQIVHTELRPVQEGSLYIEGMGTSSRDKEIKTIVPIAANNPGDFFSEGFSDVELELMKIIKIHDEITPAAGNKSLFMELMEPTLNVLNIIELK